MLTLNLAVTFTAAMLLSTAGAAVASAAASNNGAGQQPWSDGSGGDQGGATCTNCTICPYTCRGQAQPPPVGPQSPPGYGWYAPPGTGTGIPATGTGIPATGSGCPPGTAPTCCPQQQQQQNPNYPYYNSPPYSNVPYNGNELRKPVQLVFLAFCYVLFW